MKFEIHQDTGVIIVEGVRFTIFCIEDFLKSPPSGWFSFRRAGDYIEITKHEDRGANETLEVAAVELERAFDECETFNLLHGAARLRALKK